MSRLSVAGPSDLSDVVFRIVDQSKYAEVLDLLYKNFHTDEPMSRALSIFDGENRIPEADEYTLKAPDTFTAGVACPGRGRWRLSLPTDCAWQRSRASCCPPCDHSRWGYLGRCCPRAGRWSRARQMPLGA